MTLLLVMAVAGCGDDDGGSASAPAADCNGSGTTEVAIPEFAFDPDPVTVCAGDSIVWENTHDQAHTSTSDDNLWKTGNIDAGGSAQPVAFPDAGTFAYFCSLHPFMKGTVEVGS